MYGFPISFGISFVPSLNSFSLGLLAASFVCTVCYCSASPLDIFNRTHIAMHRMEAAQQTAAAVIEGKEIILICMIRVCVCVCNLRNSWNNDTVKFLLPCSTFGATKCDIFVSDRRYEIYHTRAYILLIYPIVKIIHKSVCHRNAIDQFDLVLVSEWKWKWFVSISKSISLREFVYR